MIISKSNLKKLFICQSADWLTVINAEDESEAAALAVSEAVNRACKKDNHFNIGMFFSCQEINKNDDSCSYIYSPTVLADAGFHDMAKELIQSNK
jgi:hypothetical protein